MRPDAPLFPELDDERRHLLHARACRDRMIERLGQPDDVIALAVDGDTDDLAANGATDKCTGTSAGPADWLAA